MSKSTARSLRNASDEELIAEVARRGWRVECDAGTEEAPGWPMDGPILGTVPSPWAKNAAAFVTLLSEHPFMWLKDMQLKYLNVYIDTRDGAFTLKDRDGRSISVERVMLALQRSARSPG